MWRGRLISKGTHVVTWQPVGCIHLWKWKTTDMPWHLPCLREVGFGQKCSASGVQFIPVCSIIWDVCTDVDFAPT